MNRQPILFLLVAPFAYLLLCAFTAGVLAYPLQLILPAHWIDFHTLVNRGAEGLLVLGLFPLGRRLAVGKAEMGMGAAGMDFRKLLLNGFGLGLLMLGLHTVVLFVIDVREINYDKLEILRLLRQSGKALLIGLAVASIEEPVFRGFLLGSLAARTSRMLALLISSLYFAALHFLNSELRPEPSEIHFDSGVLMLVDAFSQIRHVSLNPFIALFTAGLFLGCVRVLNPAYSLPFCIGIHAGWVFIIKFAKSFSHVNQESPWYWLVSRFDGFIGHLSSAWISVLILGLAWWIARKTSTSALSRSR
jgi:membrane protease YdiL (CAAX protease family)